MQDMTLHTSIKIYSIIVWLQDYLTALFKGNRYLGKASRKLIGVSNKEVYLSWAAREFGNWPVVLLSDIDFDSRDKRFWDSLPDSIKVLFKEDLVCIVCKDTTQMNTIMDSLPVKFATAYGMVNGILARDNTNDY